MKYDIFFHTPFNGQKIIEVKSEGLLLLVSFILTYLSVLFEKPKFGQYFEYFFGLFTHAD